MKVLDGRYTIDELEIIEDFMHEVARRRRQREATQRLVGVSSAAADPSKSTSSQRERGR